MHAWVQPVEGSITSQLCMSNVSCAADWSGYHDHCIWHSWTEGRGHMELWQKQACAQEDAALEALPQEDSTAKSLALFRC